MSSVPGAEFDRMLNEVRSWPTEQQQALADQIMQGLQSTAPPPSKKGLHHLRGLLARPGVVPPSDEECQTLLEEELLRKHG